MIPFGYYGEGTHEAVGDRLGPSWRHLRTLQAPEITGFHGRGCVLSRVLVDSYAGLEGNLRLDFGHRPLPGNLALYDPRRKQELGCRQGHPLRLV